MRTKLCSNQLLKNFKNWDSADLVTLTPLTASSQFIGGIIRNYKKLSI